MAIVRGEDEGLNGVVPVRAFRQVMSIAVTKHLASMMDSNSLVEVASSADASPQAPPEYSPIVTDLKSTTGYDPQPVKDPPQVYGYVPPSDPYPDTEGYKPTHGWEYSDPDCAKDYRTWVQKCAMKGASGSAYAEKATTTDVDKIYPKNSKDEATKQIRSILEDSVQLVKQMPKLAS
eukprot:CAMPEP_0197525944 /NCGR_PEP_ID=MMETSP1318-20131121/15278_1 /TAXON_ID=552666 /ORGANISM="Partenskyella glossopodia, Strain RCC365" /LENGTH=176 /DNA_ID=CAMNT_0043079803 /DNA_START=80 /DNA_END=613 /DNA_ORIENTATION=-